MFDYENYLIIQKNIKIKKVLIHSASEDRNIPHSYINISSVTLISVT